MVDIQQIKQEICDIGDRLYKRGFAAANDGNISYRIGPNEVLCTPTNICKGFMKPSDIATIDLDGNQLAGEKRRSSEALLHLAILKSRPDVTSVVHCHPPHATAFAVAREAIPTCVLPEVDVFLGNVPIAPYETPGGKEFAETVLPFTAKANTIILAGHGIVSYGESVERAYWLTEILDAYCRILILAKQVGGVEFMSERHGWELLALKKRFGIDDPRHDPSYAGADIFADDIFREAWEASGVKAGAFGVPAWSRAASEWPKRSGGPFDEEALVERIAERVAEKLRDKLT
jgi:L-fuculose-phosphate aldolase